METEKFMADYENALQEIERLGKIFEKEMKEHDKNFSAEYFCWMFETLLQYSFIELARADDNVSLNEIALSRRVIKYADVIALGNSLMNTEYKWSDFVNAEPSFVKEWLEKLDKCFYPMQVTFISQFAMFDSKAAGDSLAEVVKGLISVFTLFLNADNENSEEESAAVSKCKIIVTMRAIADIMNAD